MKITNPNVLAYLSHYRANAERIVGLAQASGAIKYPYWAEGGIKQILDAEEDASTIGNTSVTVAQLRKLHETIEAVSNLLNDQGHVNLAFTFTFAANTEAI